LIETRRRAVRSDLRVAALESLLAIAHELERQLGRPVTMLDLLSTDDPAERKRRLLLAQRLRS
jgi:hypothetical protein